MTVPDARVWAPIAAPGQMTQPCTRAPSPTTALANTRLPAQRSSGQWEARAPNARRLAIDYSRHSPPDTCAEGWTTAPTCAHPSTPTGRHSACCHAAPASANRGEAQLVMGEKAGVRWNKTACVADA